MIVKRGLGLLCLLLLSSVFAQLEPCDPDFQECPSSPEDQAKEAIESGGDYQGSLTEPVTVTMGGQSVTINPGSITYTGGQLTTSGTITYKGRNIQNIENFQVTEGGYSIDNVEYMEDGSRKVVQATGVTGDDTNLNAESAGTVTDGPTQTSTTTGYESTADSFSVDSAGSVIIGEDSFPLVGDSTFTFDHELISADVTSESDYNKFIVGDLEIFVDKNESVQIDKVGDRYNIKTDGRIVDYSEEGNIITLIPGARYEYVGEMFEDFAVEAEEEVTFGLRFFANDTHDNNIVDLIDNAVIIDKSVQYERKANNNFVDIIDAEDFRFEFGGCYLDSGTVFSGPFEVKKSDEVYYRLTYEVPYIVDAVDPNIEITGGFLKRTLPTNTFTLYDDSTDFLEKYRSLS